MGWGVALQEGKRWGIALHEGKKRGELILYIVYNTSYGHSVVESKRRPCCALPRPICTRPRINRGIGPLRPPSHALCVLLLSQFLHCMSSPQSTPIPRASFPFDRKTSSPGAAYASGSASRLCRHVPSPSCRPSCVRTVQELAHLLSSPLSSLFPSLPLLLPPPQQNQPKNTPALTLHPSHNFFTLDRTFIPLACSISPTAFLAFSSIAITGLAERPCIAAIESARRAGTAPNVAAVAARWNTRVSSIALCCVGREVEVDVRVVAQGSRSDGCTGIAGTRLSAWVSE